MGSEYLGILLNSSKVLSGAGSTTIDVSTIDSVSIRHRSSTTVLTVASSSAAPLPLGSGEAWAAFSATRTTDVNLSSALPADIAMLRMLAPGVHIPGVRIEVPIPEKGAEIAALDSRTLKDFCDDDLLAALRDLAAPTREICYTGARRAMFSDIDNKDGKVECVYTSRRVQTDDIPESEGENGMNTEHVWPKSRGIRETRAMSDLHHLFPSDSNANGKRSSFPFGKVETVTWEHKGSKLGLDANGEQVFEPADESKGNVARAMFYVSAIYDLEIPAQEESVLKDWHRADPVDEAERHRNSEIATYQGNRNPFVDDEVLVQRVADF